MTSDIGAKGIKGTGVGEDELKALKNGLRNFRTRESSFGRCERIDLTVFFDRM